jgi:hypothetical protein
MDIDCSNFPQNRDNKRDFVCMVINIQTNKQKPNNQPINQPANQPTKSKNYQTNQPTERTDQTDRPTNQPTPRSRVHLEKLTVLQLRKKFPVFYGNWTPPIIPIVSQSNLRTLFHPISLSSHLLPGIRSDLLPSSFQTKALCAFLLSPICHTYRQSDLLYLIVQSTRGRKYNS